MKKKATNRKEETRKALFKKIHSQLNLLNVAMSPVYLVVPNLLYTFSLDEYLPEASKGEGYPWRLIDTVDDKGWVTLRVNLNQTKARISDYFIQTLNLLFEEVKKYHRITKRVSNREFDLYLEVYKLKKEEGWTFPKIAKKMFPGDFKDYTGEGDKKESAIKKVQRFYKEAKKIIEGE